MMPPSTKTKMNINGRLAAFEKFNNINFILSLIVYRLCRIIAVAVDCTHHVENWKSDTKFQMIGRTCVTRDVYHCYGGNTFAILLTKFNGTLLIETNKYFTITDVLH